jgi:ligand-binding sensor protein
MMKLTDLLPLEKWVELEKEIKNKFGLDANVFDIDGIRITDYKGWANRLCPVIKANDKGQSFICAVAHMNLARESMENRSTVIEECDGGLVKLVNPVFVGDEFVGSVCACGVLLDDGEVDAFLINKITGIDEEEIESLSDDMPSISTQKAEAVCRFIMERINKILSDFEKTNNTKSAAAG